MPGRLTACVLASALAAVAEPSVESAEVSILVQVEAEGLVGSTGEDRSSDVVFRADGAEIARSRVSVPGVVAVEVQRGTRIVVTLDHPKFWAAERVILGPTEDRASEEAVVLHAVPAATALATLRAPRGQALPTEVTIKLARPQSSPSLWGLPDEIHLLCPVESDGKLRCKAPTGTFDLRLGSQGFIPQYFWSKDLGTATGRDLGALDLRPGASVAGRVEGLSRTDGSKEIWVTLENLSFEGRGGSSGVEDPSISTVAGAQGFFQIAGVAPGLYRLAAFQEGRARSPALEIQVLDGRETALLEPLVLEPLSRISISLQPASDPYGRPWTVTLRQTGLRERFGGEAPLEGPLVLTDLPAGSYRLSVNTHRGDRWESRDVEVTAGDTDLEVELEAVFFHGHLFLSEEPLEAHLWFGTRSGSERTHAYANEEGHFYGHLPREGPWRVEVEMPGSGGHRFPARPVAVEKPAKGPAEIEIRLPDTRFEGRVVDGSGEPISGAKVFSHLGGEAAGQAWQRTAADGSFLFQGLPEGKVTAYATHADASSEGVTVRLVEKLHPAPIQLVIEEGDRIRGQVVSAAGPVPRATLLMSPNWAEGAYRPAANLESFTDLDGRFETVVPRGTIDLHLTVLAPGFAARLLRIPVQKEAVVIPVDQHGGTLHLDTRRGAGLPGAHALLAGGGETASLTALRHFWARPWARDRERETGTLTLENMEPGHYSVCSSLRPGPSTVCASGSLPEGGALTLKLPPAPAEAATEAVRR